MLKIRLRRMGSRHKPFYRVVVSDSRKVPTGAALEEIGFYDPRKKPAVLKIDTERVDHWVGNGAQLSATVADLVKKVKKAADTVVADAPTESVATTAAEATADAASEAEPETKATAKSEVEPETKATAKSEAEPETKATAKSEATAG